MAADAGKTVTLGYVDLQGNHQTVVVTLGTDKQGHPGHSRVRPLAAAHFRRDLHPVRSRSRRWTWRSTHGDVAGLVLVGLGAARLADRPPTRPRRRPGFRDRSASRATSATSLDHYGARWSSCCSPRCISANLALVNFLPFPPLDGGKILILVVKRIFGARGVSAFEAFGLRGGLRLAAGLHGLDHFLRHPPRRRAVAMATRSTLPRAGARWPSTSTA